MENTQGYKKISRKARNGRKSHPEPHKQHKIKLPSAYDIDRNRQRKRRINDLRAADLDHESEIYEYEDES